MEKPTISAYLTAPTTHKETTAMKVKNVNNASAKTKEIIRKTFAEMLSEKKEINKISVTELVKRANINRSTFYSHYDDIYCVAEDYEDELINFFFDNTTLLQTKNSEQFIDKLFEYFKQNRENYKMLCKSNDIVFTASKLTRLSENKMLELCHKSRNLKNADMLEVELCVFLEGLMCQYIKSCRGSSDVSPEELFSYTKQWHKSFVKKHFG